MYRIYCDESWSSTSEQPLDRYFVFYGVMVNDQDEARIIEKIDDFRRKRGLYRGDKIADEIKWKKIKKNSNFERYTEFMDIFLDEVKNKKLSFGIMHIRKEEYDRVAPQYLQSQPDNKHNFLFMLYFNFLYHCFIKNQVKNNECEIFIDNRDMGGEDNFYDITRLKDILNKRLYRNIVPRNQPALSDTFKKQILDSVKMVDLADSKHSPFVQMADLCANCVRFILEYKIPVPFEGQLALWDENNQPVHSATSELIENTDPKREFVENFYRRLRSIHDYDDINLLEESRHYRFNVFPFRF
jgi:hypothetical protein